LGNDPSYNNTHRASSRSLPRLRRETTKTRIRQLAENLDAHRKARQAAHPDLTLTDLYNVLEKLRAGQPSTERDRTIHENGLVSVLKQLHDDLDAAVLDAYSWPRDLAPDALLERLVALNAERAREEQDGRVRWLRPDLQTRGAITTAAQNLLPGTETPLDATRPLLSAPRRSVFRGRAHCPNRSASFKARSPPGPASSPRTTRRPFQRARADRVAELLQTLVLLGQAREVEAGRFTI
jgi:hypothetical protein